MRPRKNDSGLPPCVYLRNGSYFYVKKNVWKNLGTNPYFLSLEETDVKPDRNEVESHLIKKFAGIRIAAIKRNLEFNISIDDIINMARASKWKCSLSGIILTTKEFEGMRFRPYAPSVDRIDSSKPYTVENCRVVAAIVNIAKNTMDDDLLIIMCEAITRENKKLIRRSKKSAS